MNATTSAYAQASLGAISSVHAAHAFLLQGGQLYMVPWILSLFLVGFVIGQAGVVAHLNAWQPLLQRGALVGLALGLPASLGAGFGGPLAGYGVYQGPTWSEVWIDGNARLLKFPTPRKAWKSYWLESFVTHGRVRPSGPRIS